MQYTFISVSEATIRFLKAKLRVMQEELDRLAHEYNKKVTETLLTIMESISYIAVEDK